LVLAHADALGATSGGTIVASGAQLRINSLADTVFAAEPLIISGLGVPSGGALRNATNNNTWQGTITLAANATIGAASGTTLTLMASTGATIDLDAYDLVVDGAGTVQVNGGIAGSGQISKTGSGQLVVSNSVLAATIRSNSAAVNFANAPITGAMYAVLPGPIDTASLASTSVSGLGAGQSGVLTNAPNLVVVVSGSAVTNSYEGWLTNYPGITNFPGGASNTNGSADPDGDGFVNNVEYAFDGNPTVGTPALMTVRVVGTNATFNWLQRTNGANYIVQNSTALTNGWTGPAAVTVSNSVDQTGIPLSPEYVRREFQVPLADKDFYRVQATLTNN